MNVTLTSLEALILKATHESLPCPDAAALEAFCTIMRDTAEGPMLAAQALAARIHASNAREALLALTMLDRCMRRCDASFHAEVGKFRFLNEMIKLVSPKYFADRTAPEVRTRVLQLLHAWSIEYPKESKFKVAYDMLKNQGVVKETPPPLPPEETTPPRARTKNAVFEDEEKSKLLQKLLQSKKPEDLQHANRLIKTMVREEERRSEAVSRRVQETGSALDAAGLLRDMLARARTATPDERELIHELHARCRRLRPALHRLAATAAEQDQDSLEDILHASDTLDDVFEKYNAFLADIQNEEKPTEAPPSNQPNNDSLLDFAGANPEPKPEKEIPKTEPVKHSVIDDLGDIFSAGGEPNISEPLKPVTLITSEETDLLGDKSNKKEAWNELDSLGEQLLKQSIPDNAKRIDSFNSKQTKKIPMNALEVTSPKRDTQSTNGAVLDLDFFTKKRDNPAEVTSREVKPASPPDDVMVDISTEDTPSNLNNNLSKPASPVDNILDIGLPVNNVKAEAVEIKDNEKKDNVKKISEVKSLSDISVTLESVHPSKVSPLTAFEEDEGVTVVLHFCKDKPRPDVNVIVISTTSKSKLPIEDYKFQAVVPKGCKVRLLPPSGTSLPAFNPFLPPPALTQVMLVARPASPACPVSLKFVITYSCDDDSVSEIGEVKQLPLDDI